MEANDSPISVKILRGILYLVGTLVVIVAVGTCAYIGYYTGKNTMNVDMIAKDAFNKRAAVILQPKGPEIDNEQLRGVFTEKCIATDEVYNNNPYAKYEITNYYHLAEIEGHTTWQWDETTELILSDVVLDIRGVYADTDAENTLGDPSIEDWRNAKYKVKLVKINNAWKVDKIEVIEDIYIPEIVKPTQEPVDEEGEPTEESTEPTTEPTTQPTAEPEG